MGDRSFVVSVDVSRLGFHSLASPCLNGKRLACVGGLHNKGVVLALKNRPQGAVSHIAIPGQRHVVARDCTTLEPPS